MWTMHFLKRIVLNLFKNVYLAIKNQVQVGTILFCFWQCLSSTSNSFMTLASSLRLKEVIRQHALSETLKQPNCKQVKLGGL